MTDEMKLLRAFIEAQGYVVEVITRVLRTNHPDDPDRYVTDYKVSKKQVDVDKFRINIKDLYSLRNYGFTGFGGCAPSGVHTKGDV